MAYDDTKTEQSRLAQQMQNDTEAASQKARQNIQSAAAEAKAKARTTAEQQQNRTADELEKIEHAAEAAAETLRDENREGLSAYVNDMARNIGELANSLRHKSVDQLVHDVEALARKNPALLISGSIAIGLGISRFAKASGRRAEEEAYSSADVRSSELRRSRAGEPLSASSTRAGSYIAPSTPLSENRTDVLR